MIDWLVLVNGPDGVVQECSKAGGFRCCADEEGHAGGWPLKVGFVKLRLILQFLGRIFDVAHHSDDFTPVRTVRVAGIDAKVFAQGFIAREKTPHKSLVDESHGRRLGIVVRAKAAATQQRNAKGIEKTRTDGKVLSFCSLSAWQNGVPSDTESNNGCLPTGHQGGRATRRGDLGKRFEVLNGFSEERGLLGRIFVPRVRKTDVCGQDVLRLDSKPCVKFVYKGQILSPAPPRSAIAKATCTVTSTPCARLRALPCEIVRPPSLSVGLRLAAVW